eukprot:scaffold122917_cov16-Prasinocladus_malaysianus.AAC.1
MVPSFTAARAALFRLSDLTTPAVIPVWAPTWTLPVTSVSTPCRRKVRDTPSAPTGPTVQDKSPGETAAVRLSSDQTAC